MISVIKDFLNSYDLPVSDEQLQMLESYRNFILERNKRINLTAIKDPDDFDIKHYVDSLSLLSMPEYKKSKTVVDLGTGAGLPGVPLAVFSPSKEFLLVDALKKRLQVIDEIASELGLKNIRTLHARAEDLGKDDEYREKFDLCVSRAVAELNVLSEYCLPLVKLGGYFIAYKGSSTGAECQRAERAIRMLGGKIGDCRRYDLRDFTDQPGDKCDKNEHCLLVIKKAAQTPIKYPRRAGRPAKKPIR